MGSSLNAATQTVTRAEQSAIEATWIEKGIVGGKGKGRFEDPLSPVGVAYDILRRREWTWGLG